MSKIAVVIVNFNTGTLLRECLGPLFESSEGLGLEVEVVDNGSEDGSADGASRKFPEMRLSRTGRNLGFAAAANIALRRIRDEGRADYVLLLNPDVAVEGTSIARLAEYLDSHPDVGAVGPALVLPDGRFQAGAGGFLPTARTGFAYFFFPFKVFPGLRSIFLDQAAFARRGITARVEWLSGACLMFRRAVLERAGLLDETFFLYGEDIAWGKAMGEAGIEIRFHPKARVVHHHGASANKAFPGANTIWLDMVYRFVRKESGAWAYALFRLFSVGGFFLRWAGYSLAGLRPGGLAARRSARDNARFLSFSIFGSRLAGIGKRPDATQGQDEDSSGPGHSKTAGT